MAVINIINNFVEIENKRDIYAKNNKIRCFVKTYEKKYDFIKNNNDVRFWDDVYLKRRDEYSFKLSPINKHKTKIICDYLKNLKGSLLNIGFGMCSLETALKSNNNNKLLLHGIEISKICIQNAQKLYGSNFKFGTIQNIPYNDEQFDYIVCSEIFEHINPSELFKSLKEIYRTLKKEGILIITIPINENLPELLKNSINPNSHVRVYTKEIIEMELKIFGFNVIYNKYFYAFKNNYIIKNILINSILKNIRKPNNLLLIARKE